MGEALDRTLIEIIKLGGLNEWVRLKDVAENLKQNIWAVHSNCHNGKNWGWLQMKTEKSKKENEPPRKYTYVKIHPSRIKYLKKRLSLKFPSIIEYFGEIEDE